MTEVTDTPHSAAAKVRGIYERTGNESCGTRSAHENNILKWV